MTVTSTDPAVVRAGAVALISVGLRAVPVVCASPNFTVTADPVTNPVPLMTTSFASSIAPAFGVTLSSVCDGASDGEGDGEGDGVGVGVCVGAGLVLSVFATTISLSSKYCSF